MAVLFAFSLQHEVEKYGAYVGLAAFLGLAVLTVLYFAQARELKRLRDWAGRAPERAQEIEARVVAQADELRRGPAVAEPERSGTVGPAQPAAAPSENGRPAGPIPIGPRPAVAVAAAAARAGAGGVATAEAPPTVVEPAAPEPEPDEEPAPTAVEPAVETASAEPAAPVEPEAPEAPEEEVEDDESAVQAGNGAATPPPIPRATPRPQPRPEPASPVRASAPSRTAAVPPRRAAATAAPRRDDEGSSRTARITAITLVGVIVLAGAIFAATQLFGGGSDKPTAQPNVAQPPTGSSSPSANGGSASVADQRPDTVVAVLNGTPTDGLAGTTRDKLVKAGYSDAVGMVRTGNNTDQQRQDSVVFYASGKRRMARDVAQVLGITTAPEAVDQDTLALANNTGDGAAGHETDVVVIVALDQSP
jgi:hypothetical protein